MRSSGHKNTKKLGTIGEEDHKGKSYIYTDTERKGLRAEVTDFGKDESPYKQNSSLRTEKTTPNTSPPKSAHSKYSYHINILRLEDNDEKSPFSFTPSQVRKEVSSKSESRTRSNFFNGRKFT